VKLVVGLGNPGSKYEGTRHNIGFDVVDRLIDDLQARPLSKASFYGALYKTPSVLLLKPETFMNLSGKSVLAVKQFYKIELEDIIVVHDDIDLPFGAVRFKKGGGHGGHNGLKSIDAAIGRDYVRVRMGVGKPAYKSQVPDYVLAPFNEEERECIEAWVKHAAESVNMLLSHSLEEVRNRYTIKSIETLCS
jgi:PTH1 family peptidyl-tRNA hydrolase